MLPVKGRVGVSMKMKIAGRRKALADVPAAHREPHPPAISELICDLINCRMSSRGE
jgi:hypothetical protein